ncbi:MAG: sensor histidine kinase, partial [Pseudomonadota bacterium]
MPTNSIRYIDQDARSNWIKLSILVNVRWLAFTGQIFALIMAQLIYNVTVPLGLCAFAIGLLFLGNMIAIVAYPDNHRLSEGETVFMLLFDILQLCFLLSLTGG